MPPHPIHASYTHIIQAGLENIARLTATTSDLSILRNEIEHLFQTNSILTAYLLYQGTDRCQRKDSEHQRYWDEVRPAYIRNAPTECIWNLSNAWGILANATSGRELMEQIDKECEQYKP